MLMAVAKINLFIVIIAKMKLQLFLRRPKMSVCDYCNKEVLDEENEIDFHSKIEKHFCRDCEDVAFDKVETINGVKDFMSMIKVLSKYDYVENGKLFKGDRK
jgi:hypothetical protein